MSIQQTVNQGLAVAAALATQSPKIQSNKLEKQANRALDVAKARLKEDKQYGEITEGTPHAFEELAEIYKKQNSIRPNLKSTYMHDFWLEFSRDQRRQFEAQERAKIQQEAAEEQRKRIRETIMKV